MTYASEARLIILDGTRPVQEVSLTAMGKSQIVIGRSATCDIKLASEYASSVHCAINIYDGRCYIMDLQSTNGTRYNGQMLPAGNDTMRMRDGDVVRIGNIGSDDTARASVSMVFSTSGGEGSWRALEIAQGATLSIGRDERSSIVLSSMAVSRHHADIASTPAGLVLRDSGSVNGVFVNGRRIMQAQVSENDVVVIAGFKLFIASGKLLYKAAAQGIGLCLKEVTREVREKGKTKRILDGVTLDIAPNEFVAVIGGSGAGKTTLLNAMSGFEAASAGQVLCNGIDMYQNLATIKSIIGYVPQQDIVYENLSLRRMLLYAAKLRLPDASTAAEREERVASVLGMVGLAEHSNTLIRKLSGGQRKRASIAVELLADPGLFFLDEPSSGLDPDTEKNLMLSLSDLAHTHGKTVLMITHTVQNLDLCDKVICMGAGGRLCFIGTPAEALEFFGVKDLIDVYPHLNNNSMQCAQSFKARLSQHRGRAEAASIQTRQEKAPANKGFSAKRSSGLRQFLVLTARSIELLRNDARRLALTLLQAPLIALLLAIVSSEDVFLIYEDTRSILFALTCACIWMGVFNSIQEVCKEKVILKREYMASLKLPAYMLSKLTVQAILAALQAGLLVGVFVAIVGLPGGEIIMPAALEVALTLFVTIFSSSALGLLVSAVSTNPDRAMTVAPFILIVQLLFSSVLFILEGPSELISYLTISRWSIGALGVTSDLNGLDLALQEDFPMLPHDAEGLYDHAVGSLGGDWAIMLAFVVVYATAATILLRRLPKTGR